MSFGQFEINTNDLRIVNLAILYPIHHFLLAVVGKTGFFCNLFVCLNRNGCTVDSIKSVGLTCTALHTGYAISCSPGFVTNLCIWNDWIYKMVSSQVTLTTSSVQFVLPGSSVETLFSQFKHCSEFIQLCCGLSFTPDQAHCIFSP